MNTISSRDFTRDVAAAKRATNDGPVFITDRGRPAFALLKIGDYERLSGTASPSLFDLMEALPSCSADVDFPKLDVRLRNIDLA